MLTATTTQTTPRDARPIPDRAHAEGMLAGIQAQRAREGHGPAPYDRLDLDSATDRRIIGSVYAMMAREALDQMSGAGRG